MDREQWHIYVMVVWFNDHVRSFFWMNRTMISDKHTSKLVFVQLLEQAEQRSFVPPIMMIERNFTCSNKKTNMDKNYIQRNSWTFGSPAYTQVRKSEKKSLVTYLLPHQRGNTAGPLQIHGSERAEAMLRCRHCCCGYPHTIAQMRMTQLR